MAAVGLTLTGLAQAAPPDPVTLGATTLSNIRLNGVTGTQLAVAPGADVTITADWSDNNTGCPSCIDNLPVAFQGFGAQPAGCIEDFGFFGFSGTGTVDLGAAPFMPGTYDIVGNFEETFFCGQFWTVPNTFPTIAQVVVTCDQTVTDTVSAPLQIGPGITCINGGTVAGPVSVSAGAVVVLTGATIYGPLNADGAAQVVVCDSTIAGPVSVSGSTGPVLIGSAAGSSPACGGNTILGPVTLTGNSGPAAVVAGNTIAGILTCTANAADPTDNGNPNTVQGPALGQCAALG
jgi:hypothetical protein